MTMTNDEIIRDLEVIRAYFLEESEAEPACIGEAIRVIKEVNEKLTTEKPGRLIDADALKAKLQKHHDFFIDAWNENGVDYNGMPIPDKSRVDEITNCIAMVQNAPTVDMTKPMTKPMTCQNCDSGYAQGYSDGYLKGKEEGTPGIKKRLTMTVPNYRTYEDYHDAVQYVRGWNDAMQYIFGKEADNDNQTGN